MPTMRRTQTYGLWAITTPRGHSDKRVFLDDKKGNWPVSQFQRSIGLRLHPPKVYRRSFARMGDWKGFFQTHVAGSAKRRLRPLLREVCVNLGAPRALTKICPGAAPTLRAAKGHAVIWAKTLRLRSKPPLAILLARIYVKGKPLGDA